MLREYVKGLLFLLSYMPLFIILLIKNFQVYEITIAMCVLIIFPSLYLSWVFRDLNSVSGKFTKIDSVQSVDKVALEYFVAYIIPFLNFNLGAPSDALSLGILITFMGIIYVKSDMIYMNPILNFAGFSILKVISDNKEIVLITKKKKHELKKSEELIELGQNVHLGRNGRTYQEVS